MINSGINQDYDRSSYFLPQSPQLLTISCSSKHWRSASRISRSNAGKGSRVAIYMPRIFVGRVNW